MADKKILPWRPLTRQRQGIETEKKMMKQYGGVRHPSSGAGPIKDDGHTDAELYEIKDGVSSHTVKVKELEALYKRGVRQGRRPVYVIHFGNGIVLEGTVRMCVCCQGA